jgi:tetratricopeptide (TPR) repeat protein
MDNENSFKGIFKRFGNFFKTQPKDIKFRIAMERAISKLNVGRLKSARDEMLVALRDSHKPLSKIEVAYNLGAIYWAQIGNGEKAREYYKQVVSEAEKYGIPEVDKLFPSIVANVCENMMHLSLSYEEFFYWEEKMRKLQPSDNVLRTWPPIIRKGQQKGLHWSEILLDIAYSSYNRNNPGIDRGEYGRAVSTFHLMLVHRKDLRYSREIWGHVVYEYGALAMRIADNAVIKMAHSKQPENTEEFRFIVKDAIPFVEEYFQLNPSNTNVQQLLKNINGFLGNSDNVEKSKKVAKLNKVGNEFLTQKDFKTAYKNYKEAEEISRSIGDENLIQISIGNLALIAMDEGDAKLALELTLEKEAICRKNNFFSSLANALANKAQILNVFHNLGDAIKCAEESSQLCVQHELNDIAVRYKSVFERFKQFGSVVNCCKCEIPKVVVKGFIRSEYILSQNQYGFKCRKCGRITCYDCSDNRIPCKCDAKEWMEIMFYK